MYVQTAYARPLGTMVRTCCKTMHVINENRIPLHLYLLMLQYLIVVFFDLTVQIEYKVVA